MVSAVGFGLWFGAFRVSGGLHDSTQWEVVGDPQERFFGVVVHAFRLARYRVKV